MEEISEVFDVTCQISCRIVGLPASNVVIYIPV